MRTQLSMLWGTVCYEFCMQLRRRELWIVMGLSIFFIFYLQHGPAIALLFHLESWQRTTLSPRVAAVIWADQVNRLLPVVVGILLADRFPRDRHIKVEEFITTLPPGPGLRIVGKYVGCLSATLIAPTLYYTLGIGILLLHTGSFTLVPTALLAFLSIVLPGMLFVGAFSVACPAFLWWPIYCFCFTAYWFWGNLLSPTFRIPTISTTILTPLGGYMSQGFFGVAPDGPIKSATSLQGLESLLLLLGLAGMALLLAWILISWQQSRQ